MFNRIFRKLKNVNFDITKLSEAIDIPNNNQTKFIQQILKGGNCDSLSRYVRKNTPLRFFKSYRSATSVLVPSETLLSIIRIIIVCLTFKNYIFYLFIAEG